LSVVHRQFLECDRRHASTLLANRPRDGHHQKYESVPNARIAWQTISSLTPRESPAPLNLRAFHRLNRIIRTRKRVCWVRAADLIGQLGDPHHPRKANALYYEFEEVGMNRQLGYTFARRSHEFIPAVFLETHFPTYSDRHSVLECDLEGRQWVANLYSNVFRAERDLVDGMSAFGTKRTFRSRSAMSAFGEIADIATGLD